jgi:hypothetical protein
MLINQGDGNSYSACASMWLGGILSVSAYNTRKMEQSMLKDLINY